MEIEQPTNLTSKPMIEIQKVTKSFASISALDKVDLKINKGELFCLLGSSGCGKSTLLRILAGFETITSGKVFIDGVSVESIPPHLRPVNMMFQSYALFPHLSVYNNIVFGLKRAGWNKKDIQNRLKELLNLLSLNGLESRMTHQLSGGQKQRVALARSLALKPKVLLLDEPLAALDKGLREQTQLELVNIQEKLGTTFVLVTHDQEEAMTLACRIAVMNEGKIIQIGKPKEIYEFPQNKFVAGFFGSVNIFDGHILEDEANYTVISCPKLDKPIRVAHGISCHENQQVWVALRPEKIQISKSAPNQKNFNYIKGIITEVAYKGSNTLLHTKLNSGLTIKISVPNSHRHESNQLTWDDAVHLTWDKTSAVVLTS